MSEQIPDEAGIMTQVASVFDPSMYDFEVSCKIHSLRAICDVKIVVKDIGSQCLYLQINIGKTNKIIKINTLAKCANDTGPELLQKVNALAKLLDVKTIELTDASLRNYCDTIIHLPILSILTTGSTWYNSQGYVSDNHDEIMRHNASIVDGPFVKLMYDAQKGVGDNSDLMAKLNAVVEITADISVKTYVNKLVASIGRGDTCSKSNAILLNELVGHIASARILEFDQKLYHKLSGGRRMRMQTKRNRKCKKTKRNNKRTNKR